MRGQAALALLLLAGCDTTTSITIQTPTLTQITPLTARPGLSGCQAPEEADGIIRISLVMASDMGLPLDPGMALQGWGTVPEDMAGAITLEELRVRPGPALAQGEGGRTACHPGAQGTMLRLPTTLPATVEPGQMVVIASMRHLLLSVGLPSGVGVIRWREGLAVVECGDEMSLQLEAGDGIIINGQVGRAVPLMEGQGGVEEGELVLPGEGALIEEGDQLRQGCLVWTVASVREGRVGVGVSLPSDLGGWEIWPGGGLVLEGIGSPGETGSNLAFGVEPGLGAALVVEGLEAGLSGLTWSILAEEGRLEGEVEAAPFVRSPWGPGARLALMVDQSASMLGLDPDTGASVGPGTDPTNLHIAQSRDLVAALDRMGGHSMALVALEEEAWVVLGPTADLELVDEALVGLSGKGGGAGPVLDGLALAASLLTGPKDALVAMVDPFDEIQTAQDGLGEKRLMVVAIGLDGQGLGLLDDLACPSGGLIVGVDQAEELEGMGQALSLALAGTWEARVRIEPAPVRPEGWPDPLRLSGRIKLPMGPEAEFKVVILGGLDREESHGKQR